MGSKNTKKTTDFQFMDMHTQDETSQVIETEVTETPEDTTTIEYGATEDIKQEEEIVVKQEELKLDDTSKKEFNQIALMSNILTTFSATISRIVKKYKYHQVLTVEKISPKLYEIRFKVNGMFMFAVVFEPLGDAFSLQKIKAL